ncbi:MAG TPA: alpha-E domain-containing protein, partial [Rhodocyclaceae bacterium]|nr:alpha-E domain-containing protein [Rhodocyclaceae bacterium]
DLIVFDDSNPHSIVFQIEALLRYQERIARDLGEGAGESLVKALAELRAFDLARLAGVDFSTGKPCPPCFDLAQRLYGAVNAARTASDSLAQHYFTHTSDIARQVWAA